MSDVPQEYPSQEPFRREEHLSLDDLPEAFTVAEPSGMNLAAIEKRLRMQKVLLAMREEDVDVLFERYVEMRTLEEIAEDLGVTHQAVSKRLTTARANFLRAFAQEWNNG